MATFKNNLLFDYLKNILQLKSEELFKRHIESPDFRSSFSCYMVLRYLSMSQDERIRNLVMENQRFLDKLSPENLYCVLLKTFPKVSNSFIKYIKG